MAKAIWQNVVLAESDHAIELEGNLYFPHESLDCQYFLPSDKATVCSWKGTAHYYHLEVDGKLNRDAAWFYPNPKPAVERIRNRVAFWKGVQVVR